MESSLAHVGLAKRMEPCTVYLDLLTVLLDPALSFHQEGRLHAIVSIARARLQGCIGLAHITMPHRVTHAHASISVTADKCPMPSFTPYPHYQPQKILEPFLDLCVSSLREGHANLLCIVPILTDVAEATQTSQTYHL